MLDRFVRRYEGADLVIRMKAKLFVGVFLSILVLLPFIIFYTVYNQRHSPDLGFRVNAVLIAAEAFALLFLVFTFALLLRGRFSLAAHLLLILTFSTTWTVMFLDRSGAITRLDSVVFIIGILTMAPLAVARRKRAILLYGALNFAAFLAFAFHARRQLDLPLHEFLDYLADTSVAMLFVVGTAFSVFLVNQRALQRMEEELDERRRQESEKARLQEHLLHAQKMESVGRLAGGVAHDFNNLLTTIMGNASLLLLKLGADSPSAPRLNDVIKAADSAAMLTRQLLAFSRKQVIEPRLIDLNQHIERVAHMLRRLISESIRPVLDLGPGIGPVMADPSQVEQVLINLVVNAGDAMPEGGTVTIRTRAAQIGADAPKTDPVLKPGDYAALSVSDTGTGIAADVIPHIFDPFFTTKPVGKGTGLGLASVYGAVLQNNGAVAVRSEPGRGSTMTVYLPVVALAALDAAPEAEAGAMPRGTETLLVVEDDAGVLDFIATTLSGLGYRVRTAASGADALAALETLGRRADLLLADVILSDMTGPELTARARRDSAVGRVIYMSGHAENVIVHRGIVDPGVNFIAKPFSAREIARKVREVLDGRGQGTEDSSQ
jgi:signal transduction histidine kinase/ActR/RegA family two-component response regulator